MTTIVYGASDDLIEVEGDVSEEFNPAHDEEDSFLAFSNGVVLKIVYDSEGFWRIVPRAGAELVTIEFATDLDASRRPDGSSGYSDCARIEGQVQWCVFGPRFEAARR